MEEFYAGNVYSDKYIEDSIKLNSLQ
jgi:hypothetical protein